MKVFASYVICTSPRSGSTLLCKLLAATRVAGNPASYFHGSSVEDWLDELGLPSDTSAPESDVLKTAFGEATRLGRDGTGVFGLRQQQQYLEFLREKLAVVRPQGRTDRERLESLFGPMLFLHLSRADKLAQAVSCLKAEQSGLWHVAANGSELERLAPHREPIYDFDAVRRCVEMLTDYDRKWEEWFRRETIDPLRISYDELSADPTGTLRHVLCRLGLGSAAADGIEPDVKKLADSTSQDWMARYRRDLRTR